MKIVSGVFGALILMLVLCFALPNSQGVAVGFWPVSGTASVPLYIVGLVPLAFGMLVGGLLGWLNGVPHRLRARRLNKELDVLNDKINSLQRAAIVQHPQPAKKPFWKR